MSRAFVKEQDESADVNEHLVASRSSSETDYITPEGSAALHRRLAEGADADERVAIERRLAGSIVIEPPEDRRVVAFGATVVVEDAAGHATTYHIVGTTEIDVARHAVGFRSPLAEALIGKRAGNVITWRRPAGDRRLTIAAVTYPAPATA